MTNPTIYALSSGTGRAGIAVIRITGPATKTVLQALTASLPQPRKAHLTTFRSPRNGMELDRGIALYFPGPDSFTGEDVAELHIHGSAAVIRRMLEELASMPDTELAAPGAFTERAFNNGKMDLTEVEGLADLIAAETEMQRRQALAQSSGVLRGRAAQWRATMIHARALIEAVLDFSDESDVTDGPVEEARTTVHALVAELQAALSDTARADRIRMGLRVAIIGPPNVGKSSLMNALAARDVAIVTDQPGTTRDIIEVHLELAGMPVTLLDTAGLRDSSDVIEQQGIERARKAAADADLVLHVNDPSTLGMLQTAADQSLCILNKSDLAEFRGSGAPAGAVWISAKTGAGMDELIDRLTDMCRDRASGREPPLITRERQRLCLQDCVTALTRFEAGDMLALELRAEDLRTAAAALGRLTGEIDAEDVLDDIFSGFCIGK